MRALSACVAVLLGAIGTGQVQAQAQTASLGESAAVICLTPTLEQHRLEYPADALKRKDGGTVHVELKFVDAGSEPDVRIGDDEPGNRDLAYAVKRHVQKFRLPCMKRGDSPVVLRQEYVFEPNDGRKVMSTRPTDPADVARREQMKCVDVYSQAKKPVYPLGARRDGTEGKVFVRLRFAGADTPPTVTVLASRDGRLESSVRANAERLRMPCQKGEPFDYELLYDFRLEDGGKTVLKDMRLLDLLRVTKDMPLPAYFDFDTMQCPFDVRLYYMRPHVKNHVGQLENTVPARQPFLDWLSQLTLDLPPATNTAVLGEEMTITVSCGKLDL